MKIAIASDHCGVELKSALVSALSSTVTVLDKVLNYIGSKWLVFRK